MTITDTTHVAAEQDSTTAPVEAGQNPHFAAVVKIMDETRCTQDEAVAGILFIEDMVKKAIEAARAWDTPGTHHLTDAEMSGTGYRIMDAIMPHGQAAKPDSAHALVQRIMGPSVVAITHNNTTGRREDCSVTVEVLTVS